MFGIYDSTLRQREATPSDNLYSAVPVVSGAVAKKGAKWLSKTKAVSYISDKASQVKQFVVRKADETWGWLKSQFSFRPYTKGVVQVNGQTIKNGKYAGQTVQTAGGPVSFDSNGFPDFTPYSQQTVRVDGLTGDYKTDVALVNAVTNRTEVPEGMVWHHHQDGKSMMLVP